jgi:hypothetical protein
MFVRQGNWRAGISGDAQDFAERNALPSSVYLNAFLRVFGVASWDECRQVQTLHLRSGPRRFSKKPQAGFHRGIILETIDIDFIGQFIPTVEIHKPHDDALKRQSMQGVIWLLAIHTWCTSCLDCHVNRLVAYDDARRIASLCLSSSTSVNAIIPHAVNDFDKRHYETDHEPANEMDD